jgi:hypothetical protein
MADDLDQGYMQTRQTMRDWQNRMLFMEPTQEGRMCGWACRWAARSRTARSLSQASPRTSPCHAGP